MEPTTTQLGPYRLVRHLATGGMADVWLAEHEGPEGFRKDVVIKRIRGLRSGDDEFRTMFLDEARLTALLSHPNIVQVHELGEFEEEFFVAMEFVDGCDLEAVMRRDGKLDWAVAAYISEQLLLALIYVSELEYEGDRLDIVHRDISPSNVLLSKSGHVKLADFGVAKALSNHHKTQTGATKGKLSYMSPEQVRADPLDVRSDLFALGINLYQMVTGVLPFGDGVRALHAIQDEPPPPIESDVPAELVTLIDRALAKAPGDRFQSPEDMHDAIIGVMRANSVHVSQRDVAELVESGPVAATAVAIPSAKPTTLDIPPTTKQLTPTATSAETALVGARRPVVAPANRPSRIPWILVGVLFGMLIAGAASTVAFMSAEQGTAAYSADTDAADESRSASSDDEQKSASPKAPQSKEEKRAKEKRDEEKEEQADEEEDRRERAKEEKEARKKADKKLERERKKREREIKKRLERERKRIEREAKKWKL